MHKLLYLLLFISLNLFGQSLSIYELQTICSKKDWGDVNSYLNNKKWEYYESERGSDEKHNIITWSFGRTYGDEAEAWFYLFTYEGMPNKIHYTVFSQSAYLKIQNSLSKYGYKKTDSRIEDNRIINIYANNKYIIKLRSTKREEDDYSNAKTITSYDFSLILKSGVYDPNNGIKKEYHENGEVASEYNLKDGLMNGKAKFFYDSGELKQEGYFIKGKANGSFKEYYRNGGLLAELNMKNHKQNGLAKFYYPNGELKKIGNYKNGEEIGKWKEFNEDGTKQSEYTLVNDKLSGFLLKFEDDLLSEKISFKDDKLNGKYVQYYYDDSKKVEAELHGYHKNDKKDGGWYFVVNGENKKDTLKITTYKDGKLSGLYMENFGRDSILTCHYKDDMLNGHYKLEILNSVYNLDGSKFNFLTIDREGQYSEGVKVGEWKYYSMGSMYLKGNYKYGSKSGVWTRYVLVGEYADSIMSKTSYSTGHKSGLEEFFYDVKGIKDTSDGTFGIKFISYPIYEAIRYSWGLKTGEYIKKDSLGQTLIKGRYSHNRKNGDWKYYSNSGNLERIVNYDEGKKKYIQNYKQNEIDFLEVYDSKGLIRVGYYINSKIIENHVLLNQRKGKYSVEVSNYSKEDTIIVTTYEVECASEYTRACFNNSAIKKGPYKVHVGKVDIIEGNYINGQKWGVWRYKYPNQNVIIEREYDIGGFISEKFFDGDRKEIKRAKIEIRLNNELMEIIKVKNGLRHGKSKKINLKGEVIEIVKYKRGVLID